MATGRKWDLIRNIRVAESVLGMTGAAKLGPLGRYTIDDLKVIWSGLYRTLRDKGLLKPIVVNDAIRIQKKVSEESEQRLNDLEDTWTK